MSKDLTDVDSFTSPIHVPEGIDSRDDAAGDVELIAQALANRTRNLKNAIDPLAADAARKSAQNTFTKTQIINSEGAHADDPLISTTAKPGDDPTDLSAIVPAVPAGSNRWKLIMAAPTQGSAYAGIFVGQSPYGAALVNNARWHVGTQRWRQIDPAFVSTAMVGRSGQWIVSHVPAGAGPWIDWPLDSGGDFIAGGNLGAHSDFAYVPPHAASDWTIPLSCSSGETIMQADGSYKVGSNGAAWALKVPDLTVLTNMYVLVNQASTGQCYAALVRRNKGTLLVGSAFPALDPPIAEAQGTASAGVQTITLAANGHVVESASWEYSVIFKRSHVDDKIGRIALGTFVNVGPRNLG
jgi:hypothetical protein